MPRRPDLPCSGCGKLMWRGTTSRLDGTAKCQPCRRSEPTYRVPGRIANGEVQTWVCDGCGILCGRMMVKGRTPRWCSTCRSRAYRVKVTQAQRFEVYRRDSWTCWLCEEDVDSTLIGSRSIWRPSLDHVIPRAHGGADDLGNLRLAHWWCNSVRCDARFDPEVFRVAA